jgi:hypothetical protein
VAEDHGGPALPRRVPGTNRGPGTGPLARPVLSESDLQRIRAALDSAHAQVSAPPAGWFAPRPGRVPGVGSGSEQPVVTGRLELPAASLSARPEEAPTEALPVLPAPRPGDAPEETEWQPEVTAQPGPTAAPAGPSVVPAQPATAPPESPPPPPKPAPPESTPPTAPAPPPAPAGPRRRRRGRAIITGSAIVTLILLTAGSALLLTRHAGTAKASPDASMKVAVRAAAAAWVADQVGRADLISCDQAMCRTLHARGVSAGDLVVLKPGRVGPFHSAVVVVVTAAVRKMVGSRRLAADAPAAIASFGSGAGRIVIRVVFPRGAAAYAAALRKEIADRKTAGSSLLLQGPVTASAVARQELHGGQVDSRLLLTLTELASRWPVTIVEFGDRAPGASPGIPFRSADLVVTDSKTGPAPPGGVRVMSDFAHQLGGFFAGARIRTVQLASGQDVVRIEFRAPGRFRLLGASAR